MTRRNRGKKSNDDKIFGAKWLPVITNAVDDFCYLLTRGYSENSVLQIVGNRYRLNKRQRRAIQGMCCSDQQLEARKKTECQLHQLKNAHVEIDGFNLLILLESALSSAYIFMGRDGACRDISSVHGSYKSVSKTKDAILLVGKALQKMGIQSVKWYFDKPVSNSGRMKIMLFEISEAENYNWEVELAYNPDKILADSKAVVISSDSWILDRVARWYNLGAYLIENEIRSEHIISV